ncbi:MAG: restriction endonuclease [Candidatus Anammoxibacter sp.]
MNIVSEFVVGEIYSNDQIRLSLHVETLGGVRPSLDESKRLRHIAIITSSENAKGSKSINPYHDRIEDDILIYTAAGRIGNQVLSGRNKRIIEQYNDPIPFFGFINQGQQMYEYLGILEVVRHYKEQQVDKLRNLRDVWVFEFLIHRNPSITPIESSREIAADIFDESEKKGLITPSEREIIKTSAVDAIAETASIEAIRAQLLDLNPYKFEHLIKLVLEKNGFCNVEVTKSSGDGGIDLNSVVGESHDFFAGTFVQLQVKRWRHAVGSVEINNFRGAMSSTAKGLFITTSSYTKAAVENAYNKTKSAVTLLDGYKFSSIAKSCNIDISSFL